MYTNITRANPFSATVAKRYSLTKNGSTKQTFHVTLNIKHSGITFRVGDSLGIYPQNDPILVQHLIDAMKASGDESIIEPRTKKTTTLRTFLTHKANLARLTSPFLKLVHDNEPDHKKKSALQHLLQDKELLRHYFDEHEPLDLLKDHAAPLQDLCDLFSPLLPRFYSVASSQLVEPDTVDLTVALFTYTHAGEKRHGVASHFLCHLAKEHETPIPIYLQPANGFTLPDDSKTNIIMVGPGTGVAPFRAFLQERLHTSSSGKNWLFFGERNRHTDYLYGNYFDELSVKGFLRLDLAFSRDQADKIYVQHKMYENKKDLWRWLQDGAIFYVCGDAQRMAKDVEHMLQRIAIEEGGMSLDAAKAYVKDLRAQKRYLADVY